MAKNQKSLRIVLRQNKNEDSRAYGKWYAELMDRESISTRALAKHIASHGSPYTEDMIIGILAALSRCIPEIVSEGTGVKLDGLGQFYPSLPARQLQAGQHDQPRVPRQVFTQYLGYGDHHRQHQDQQPREDLSSPHRGRAGGRRY